MLDMHAAILPTDQYPTSPEIILDDLESHSQDLPKSGHSHSHRVYQIHGLLMCVAFGAMLPLGIAAISWKPISSFRDHWVIQLFFTSTSFFGIYVAVSASTSHGGVSKRKCPQCNTDESADEIIV